MVEFGMTKTELLVHRVLAVILVIAVFAIEPFYRQPLFDLTLKVVPGMQVNEGQRGFWEFITDCGDVYAPLVGIILFFNFFSKMDALYLWAAYGFNTYVNAVLKTIRADPRPFWIGHDITPSGCRPDFGNPSGHSQTTVFFWIALYLKVYFNTDAKNKYRPTTPAGIVGWVAFSLFVLAICCMVPYSRVWLGEHSINQVLYGSTLGLVFAVVFHFRFKPYFDDLPNIFNNISRKISTHTNPVLSWVSFYLLAFIATVVVPMGFSTIMWKVRKEPYVPNPDWLARVAQFCPAERHGLAACNNFDAVLMQTAIIGLFAGPILGQLVEFKFHNQTPSDYSWFETHILKSVARVFLTLVLIVFSIIVPMGYINKDAPLTSAYVIMLLPITAGPLILFAYGRLFSVHVKLGNSVKESAKHGATYDEEASLQLQKKLLANDA